MSTSAGSEEVALATALPGVHPASLGGAGAALHSRLESVRREPFRLFFPLGLMIAAAGVVPWLSFGRGWILAWPGLPHSLAMTQGFLLAMAIGFLGTMLPRRTKSAPLSTAELVVLAVTVVLAPALLILGATVAGEAVMIVALATVVRFVAVRFLTRPAEVSIPPSFLFIPQALLHGVVGAILLMAPGSPWRLDLGRALVGQGVVFPLVLALAPLLLSIIAHGRPPTAGAATGFGVDGLVAAGFSASFVCEAWLSGPIALFARGAFVTLALSRAGVWTPCSRAGLHRSLFRLSLLLLPIGIFAAALFPGQRVAFLHVAYVGGLGLLTLSTSVHVIVSHTGRGFLADRRPWPLVVAAVLLVCCAALRSQLDHAGARYFDALTLAAVLWLLGVLVWAAFLVPMLLRPAASPGHGE